jgi:uncharacterized protein involved in exopolysaccharide biosynthesis
MDQQQAAPEMVDEEINLLDLLLVLVKRKWLIIGMTLVAAVASVIYSLTLPNIYTATAKILPPQKEGGNLSAALGQLGGLAAMAGIGGGFGGSADLYVSLLKSRSVADAVIKKLDLMKEFKAKTPDDARSKYAGSVKVQAGVKDGIISISADHRKPEMAAKLVTATVEELGRRSVQLNLAKVSNDRIFLEKRLETVRQDLKKAEDAMKNFAEQNKTIQVDSQAKASIEAVARLKGELATKEVQLAALRSYQTDESQEVKALLAATSRLRSELSRYGGSGGGVGEGIPTVGNVPNLGLEYARRMREVKTQEAIYEQMVKQYELAKVQESRDTSSLQVLDDAVVPDRKSKPKRSMIVVLATVSAFFISIFASFLAEHLGKMGPDDRQRWETIKEQLRLSPREKPGHRLMSKRNNSL